MNQPSIQDSAFIGGWGEKNPGGMPKMCELC